MKKRIIRWSVLAAFAAIAVSAAVYMLRPVPLEVEAGRVECGLMQVTVSSEGRTRVTDRFVVSSPMDGYLGRVDLKEGHPLKRGTILTWLTPAPLEVRSERQRQAALEVAEAEKDAAQAGIARARLDLEQASRELKRVTALVEQGIRPVQDLDAAQTAESSARQALRAAAFAASAATAHIEEVRASLLKGEGHAIAIRSPVDGVLLHVLQRSERTVVPGTPIAEIGDSGKLEMVFEVLSTDAVKIKPGAVVIIQNWGGEDVLQGRVRLIEPGAFTKISALGVEEQHVNVIADFVAEPPPLGDGYRIEGDVVVWESPDAVQVPVSALFRNGRDWNVFVMEGGRVVTRTVQIGQRNQRNAEVLSGLSKDEVVVLYPDDRLSEATIVKATMRR